MNCQGGLEVAEVKSGNKSLQSVRRGNQETFRYNTAGDARTGRAGDLRKIMSRRSLVLLREPS